jgi:hypothetical protein
MVCLTEAKHYCESELGLSKPKLKVNGAGWFWQNYVVLLLFWSSTLEQNSLLNQNSGEFWGTLAEL